MALNMKIKEEEEEEEHLSAFHSLLLNCLVFYYAHPQKMLFIKNSLLSSLIYKT